MKKIKMLFGEINMTWKKVIIFAIITGIYTGLINMVPALKDTSLQDIAVSTEWWVLFAVIIAANCKKPVESGLKVFVFFLISQPLVYLVETPFLGMEVWSYYKYWAIITILTLPGGMIANLIRKKDLLGTLVLSVALCIVATTASDYVLKTMAVFPHHLLTIIFCVIEIIVLILCIIPKNSHKALAAILAIAAFGSTLFISLNATNTVDTVLPEGEWVCEFEESDNSTITCEDGIATMTYSKALAKENTIICTNKDGKEYRIKVEVEANHSVTLVPES